MDHKVDGSLHETMSAFEEYLSHRINMDQVGDVFVDIGGEVCPTRGHPSGPTTYLWKTCCLQSIHESLKEDCFDGMQGMVRYYNEGMLRDAGCMSVVALKTSWIR